LLKPSRAAPHKPPPVPKGRKREGVSVFGPLEKRFYDLLRLASDKPRDWAKDRLEVVWHVYRCSVPVSKRQQFFVRLRQLQHAVNRKLRNAGDSRQIVSPADTFLALVDTA
jgi:hypothetical protein